MSKKYRHSLWQSFIYAFSGIVYCLKNERNIRVHIGVGLLVVMFGIYFQLAIWEWCILFFTIGIMLVLEFINTAIEAVVDLVTEEHHPYAKIAKDVGAGAVLTFSIVAVIIGLLLFGPKLWVLLSCFVSQF